MRTLCFIITCSSRVKVRLHPNAKIVVKNEVSSVMRIWGLDGESIEASLG